jgi:hypothetical protein
MYVAEYFQRSSRGQYGGEGYIVASISALVSLAFWGIMNVEKFAETPNQKKIGVVIGLIVGFGLIQLYIYIYMIKTPWYRTNFMPPNDYIRGPINRDQGNNI